MRSKKKNSYYWSVAGTFLWLGFVGAISFMEAWLKFRAPGLTLPVGLSIGSLVFNALNKVEWALVLLVTIDISLLNRSNRKATLLLLALPLGVLILQTLWLLPALDARIPLHNEGATVPHSPLHIYYIGTELIKVISLLGLGIHLLQRHHQADRISYGEATTTVQANKQ